MQVILSNREFQQAMRCWIQAQGFDVSKYDVSVKITAGRGENAGARADITLTEKGVDDIVEESIDAEVEEEGVTPAVEVPAITAAPFDVETPTAPASGITRPFFGSVE